MAEHHPGRHRSRGRSSEGSIGRGEDSDYVMEPENDSDFLDDEDDDAVYSKKKSKAKGKGKGKGKQKANASSYTARPTFSAGENPKVMLISLKAVRDRRPFPVHPLIAFRGLWV